jgi:hypothetical protein
MTTTTMGQSTVDRHSTNQALLWLLGFVVILVLGVTFSTMRNSMVYSPTGDTMSIPTEMTPKETDKTVPTMPMDAN